MSKIFELRLSQEDTDCLRGRDRLDVDGLMKWIIFGNAGGDFKTLNKNDDDKNKHSADTERGQPEPRQ
jgi:hypothetical protein